jgi:hypothetical protein
MMRAYRRPGFIHNAWYVEHHLLIVEKIALELLSRYPEADRDLVMVLVWIHDYGKALGSSSPSEATVTEGERSLNQHNFSSGFTKTILHYVSLLDAHRRLDLSSAPTEVRIVSSADACSHLVGPFFSIYWWENPGKSISEIMEENRSKLRRDWERKIVLPEARSAFHSRYLFLLEQAEGHPSKFLR